MQAGYGGELQRGRECSHDAPGTQRRSADGTQTDRPPGSQKCASGISPNVLSNAVTMRTGLFSRFDGRYVE